MGSATREALAESRTALHAPGGAIDLETVDSLFQAGRAIGESSQLLAALADPAAAITARTALVRAVFGAFVTVRALELLSAAVSQRWSEREDLLVGIEDLGLRATAVSAPEGASLEAELFAFGVVVTSDADLELALVSKLGRADAKASLVESLLAGKVSGQTLLVVRHLVQQPRGRRIGEMLRHAASVIADQSGTTIATISSAGPLIPGQLDRLKKSLSERYGRELTMHLVIDESLVGGVRVQIGQDVIDGSISSRLADLRLQLAR